MVDYMMKTDPVGTLARLDPSAAEQLNKTPATVQDMMNLDET